MSREVPGAHARSRGMVIRYATQKPCSQAVDSAERYLPVGGWPPLCRLTPEGDCTACQCVRVAVM